MQIQKLEDTLGVILFDRSKHPIEPTDIGKQILEQARTIIAESKKIHEIIDDEKHEIRGDVRIGVIPTLAPYLVPLFISALVEKYPKINLQVSEHMTDTMLDLLKKDQIDIGLMVTPLNEEGLKELPLFYEEFYAYVSHRHTLHDQKIVSPTELKSEGLWILDEGHCFRSQMLQICNAKKAERYNNRVLYESGSLEALKKLVDRRGGYTLLPELFTLDLSKDEQSKLRKFADPIPTREVGLVVKKSYAKNKLLEAMHKEILANLPPVMVSRKNTNVIKI